jgi:hypothetical protein
MKLLLSIALTLLRAKLKQSIVAAVGVMFSITMFVTLLGFMNGLNDPARRTDPEPNPAHPALQRAAGLAHTADRA